MEKDLYTPVVEKLNELNIGFEIVEHEPALTTEQADSFIEGIEGVRTKTMFLTNKKKTQYYLLVMDDKKRLDMEKFKELRTLIESVWLQVTVFMIKCFYHLALCRHLDY